MKNFTNNFKQFTSRLSARWLIMALMMLVGTSSAWADYYITGNVIGNWEEGPNNRLKMTTHESDVVKAEVSKGGDFKIHYAATGWDVNWYKTIKKGTSTGATITGNDNGSNLNLSLQSGYSYPVTIYFDPYGDDGSPYVWAIATTGGSGGDGTKIQLAGSFNDWGNSTDICYSVDNSTCSFEKELAANNKYEFKIVIDGVWYSGSAVTVDGDKIQFQNPWNDNSSFTASNDGIYTFNVDKDKKVWITYRTACTTPDAPSIEINNESSVTLCEGSATITVDGYSSTNTYTLYKGDETVQNPTFSNGTFTVSEADTYYVTVTTCAESPKQTTGVTLSYYSAPTLTDKYSVTNATKCNNTPNNDGAISIQNGVFGVTYSLNDDEGTSWSGLAKGTYTLKATLDACNKLSDTKTVEVGETDKTPAINDISIKEVSAVCKGDNLTLQLEEAVQDGVTYTWYKSNTSSSSIGTGTSLVLTDLQETSTYILVASKTENGCTATKEASIEVTVNALPSAPTFTSDEATVCSGVAFNLNEKFPRNSGEAGTLTWYKTSDDSQVTDPASVTITEATSYYAKATNNNCTSGKSFDCTVNVDAKPILELASTPTVCPNVEIDLDNYVTSNTGTLTWYSNQERTTVITDGLVTPTERTTYYAKVINGTCNPVENEFTVDVYGIADEMPAYTSTPATSCKGTPNSDGSIALKNTIGYITYTLDGKEGDSNVWTGLSVGTHKLAATINTCPSITKEWDVVVEVEDITPVVETLTMPENFEACNGQSVTVALQNFTKEEGCSYQFTWQYSTNGGTSYTTGTVSNSATSYTKALNGTTKFRVQVTKSKDGCTSPVATSDAVTVTANSLSEPTVSIASASYDMNAGTFTVKGNLGHAGCSESIYVGYRYKLSNDDTWSDLINTHHLTEAGIFTKEGISIAGAAAGQTYLFQTYAINGHPDYQEISAVFSSSTIEVEVQDGYTVYVRRPQSGDGTNVYTNWYELSSVKGGAPYVKSGAISGNKDNNQATTNNKGGTEMTYAFTDCDGFVWDSFKPGKNQTQFHIHALNDDKQDGWGTFSKTATITAGKDNYFYLSAWSSGTYGVTITSTDQPTRGVRIKVLGSDEVISNNMASFAAISFNGNCTGKELLKDAEGDPTGFQWKYSANGTSWSDYDGEGATWNNIRPTAAGKYKLVCTMEDKTTAESNEVEITTTSKNYNAADLINIKSKLPIIMVNTGDNYGFPACSIAGNDDYPSKHADKFKKKLSVDVKIKVGDNIVYDKKARMAYRGSSSLNFKKKSYAFCPGADMCGLDEDKSPDYVKTKKIDMLKLITGGAKKSVKDKDWVLYAATPDPSMMRNILAMETFSAMTGKWGVKNQYVELYVDGVYQGVYVFMDKITQNMGEDGVQNDGRVEVKWNVDGSSKGFIVKFDKTDLADRYEIPNGDQKTFESAMKTGNTGVISYGTEIDQRFEIEYPEKEDVIDDGGSWADVYTFVKGKIDAFESALKDGDFNTVRTIIDYESWADFFILTEFAKNGDGYRASCVFVYEGGLLKAYPLWDYELSFNNETRQEHGIDSKEGLLVKQTTYNKVSGNNGTFPAPFWWTGNYYNQKTYKGLLDDPCFVAMVKARWTKHTTGEGALTKTKMQELVDDYDEALTTTDGTTTYNTPQKREALKWPYNGTTRGLTCNSNNIGYYGKGAGSAISKEVGYYKQNNVEGSLDQLNAWIGDSGRRVGLNTEIDNLAKDIKFAITVVADKTTTTPWRPVTVTVNSNSGYEYSITPEPAKLEENGHIYTLYFARPERTEGQNFTTREDAYTFTATTGQADQCGTTQGSTTSAEVKIDLADVEENCD